MISKEQLQSLAPCALDPWHLAFARAVEAEAYEAAARVCETVHDRDATIVGKTGNYPGEYASDYDLGIGYSSRECAAAIRALNKE